MRMKKNYISTEIKLLLFYTYYENMSNVFTIFRCTITAYIRKGTADQRECCE